MSAPLLYTGGALGTNAYLVPGSAPGSYLCFDVPEGLAEEA